MSKTLYKFTRTNCQSVCVRDFIYPLGEWMPKIEKLELCSAGYHYVTESQLLDWLSDELYEVEVRGDVLHGDNKNCAQEMRLVRHVEIWNDKTARLFAADCAERVLHFYEAKYPNDRSIRDYIDATRKFARGEITEHELATAWAAAWAAAWDATWDAERKWQQERLMYYLSGGDA